MSRRSFLDDDFSPKRHRVSDDHRAAFWLRKFHFFECISHARIHFRIFQSRLGNSRFFDRTKRTDRGFDRDRCFELALFVRAQRVTRVEQLQVVVDRLLNLRIRETSHERCVRGRRRRARCRRWTCGRRNARSRSCICRRRWSSGRGG
jgi:hypothetical protein